ncbi:MAG: PHP domain-containing protein [Promethearchaeota archaeon]|jgi:histidinol phosphatase-like PHP family hydrolase
MPNPNLNLHIHSNFSDGKNTIKQIIDRALKLDLDYIAITDHFTDAWKEWVSKLKDENIILEYLEEIKQVQNYVKTTGKRLVVLKGIEIDLGSSEQYIKKNIQPDNFDLILFEYLQDVNGIAFIKNIINFWKRIFNNKRDYPILGLAHFDPYFFIHGTLDILTVFLKEYQIYFEFNPSYPEYFSPKYSYFFEKLRDHEIPVAIGCDSHSLSTLNNVREPLEMIDYYNLENNLQILIKRLENKVKIDYG